MDFRGQALKGGLLPKTTNVEETDRNRLTLAVLGVLMDLVKFGYALLCVAACLGTQMRLAARTAARYAAMLTAVRL